jgi:hypothetical protein
MTLDFIGKPNSNVRARIAAPSPAFKLMPVQAKGGVVAKGKCGDEYVNRGAKYHSGLLNRFTVSIEIIT